MRSWDRMHKWNFQLIPNHTATINSNIKKITKHSSEQVLWENILERSDSVPLSTLFLEVLMSSKMAKKWLEGWNSKCLPSSSRLRHHYPCSHGITLPSVMKTTCWVDPLFCFAPFSSAPHNAFEMIFKKQCNHVYYLFKTLHSPFVQQSEPQQVP